MEITCLQENLKRGLNIVQNIIGKNLTLPVLNNILLTIEKRRLKLISTDLEIAITNWISGKVKKEGKITVPAKLLTNFVNNLPNKKIDIKFKNNQLQIKCDNFKTIINGIDPKEFPIIPKIKEKSSIGIEAKKLQQAFSQVVNFTSFSDIRPEISGVLVNFTPNEIKFVATDSFRLGEKTISLKNTKQKTSGLTKSVIIPLKTVQELIRILSEQEDDMVEILFGQNQILFKTPDTQIISRLIEGNFPNYEQLISKQFETNLILDRKEFTNIVRINSLFSSKINDIKLRVIPKRSSVEVVAQNIEVGENVSEMKTEVKGKEIEVIFNHKYLLEGLNNISNDRVMLGINSEVNPVILKPVGTLSFVYVIMPIKL